ncbi:MAG TPA: hypothetical protein VIH42_11160 [Thermoguttaceae bacterium]
MARIYCGIFGLLALLTTMARGWIHGGDTESILWASWLNMLLFSIVGLVIGWIAGKIVEDSVSSRLAAELSGKAEGGGLKVEG